MKLQKRKSESGKSFKLPNFKGFRLPDLKTVKEAVRRLPRTVKALWQKLKEKTAFVSRRWKRIRSENRKHRFPESNRFLILLVLCMWGMMPLIFSKVREVGHKLRRKSVWFAGKMEDLGQKIRLKPAPFIAGAIAACGIAVFFSFYTVGTHVVFDGQDMGCVSTRGTVKSACREVERITAQTLGTDFTVDEEKVESKTKLTLRKHLISKAELKENLFKSMNLVTYGYTLQINGEAVASTTYSGALEELLQQLKNVYVTENTVSCEFVETTSVTSGYVPTVNVSNLGHIAELVNSTKAGEVTYTIKTGDTWSEIADAHDMSSSELKALNPGYNPERIHVGEVLTISNAVPYLTTTQVEYETYVANVPYTVEYQDDASMWEGDYKVLSAGVYGKADVAANVTYTNGEEVERQVISYALLSSPKTEVQLRGTKERPSWAPTGTFRWPCSGVVTSRFGPRNLSYSKASKNHKGIDIGNGKGTPIYASDGGTVTYSGWMSGYGYLVIINHGNGYQTYYGHNSSNIVSVGEKVHKGQQIAKMGSTGNSTGNHCHFGIMKNGVFVNPLNYI